MNRMTMFGAASALGLGLLVVSLPAQAQFVPQTEGSYSGRYTRDYSDYNTGRSTWDDETDEDVYAYRGDNDWGGGYRDWDGPGWAAGCSDNEGGYRYYRCRSKR